MITTPETASTHSIERVQIKRLASIVFGLTTLAAIPGFLAGWYPILILTMWIVGQLNGKGSTIDNNWAIFLLLSLAVVVGWWLYWTYWLELEGSNRYGKVSWFVSALANAGGVMFAGSSIRAATTVGPSIVMLVWCFVMTVLSVWVWLLRMREPVNFVKGKGYE